MPKMRRRVVCGLSETIATLPPHSALTSVDFPTFGRPATATKPDLMLPPQRRPSRHLRSWWAPSSLRSRGEVPAVRDKNVGRVLGDRTVPAPEVHAVEPPP